MLLASRLSVVFTIIFTILVFFYLHLTSIAQIQPTNPRPVAGRWKAVRKSLELPPLSDKLTTTALSPLAHHHHTNPLVASRFDLRWKRMNSEAMMYLNRDLPPLHFASDIQHEPAFTYEESNMLFRSVHEKENAEQEQDRLTANPKRPRLNNRRTPGWIKQDKTRFRKDENLQLDG